ncbi:MAG: cation diffusion facilitator family transporter [Desulfuromonadaceae bacterium]|nr:cation diffusion facilitator family transporter [Desulfuromonadaceae bacterium]
MESFKMTPDMDAGNGSQPPADKGKRLAAYSFILNFSLTLVKYLLFLLTGSASLLAETVHSLTDVLGSLLVFGGIYLAGKKSAQFPLGLYKAENLAALLSAGLILLSGYEIGRTILYPTTGGLQHLDATLAILLFMTLPIFLFSRYERRKAQELNSPSLLADAENWRTDLAPLAIVMAGIAGARFSYAYFDRIAAFAVLLLVVKAGYGIARDAVKSLLDASVDKATLEKMSQIVVGFPEVTELVSLTARNSGRYIFANIIVRLSLKRLKAAHGTIDRIDKEIRRLIPFVEKVSVHYEPEAKECLKNAAMLADREGRISDHFGAAPFVALWDKRKADGEVLSREILENPFMATEKGKGIRLAEFLVGMQIDILYTREVFSGKGPAYVFSDAEVEVRTADTATIDELVARNDDSSP